MGGNVEDGMASVDSCIVCHYWRRTDFFCSCIVSRKAVTRGFEAYGEVTGYLELFPKIGGTLAVLTGIALILLGDYGAFTQIWLIGSLVIYILIQILVVAIITPQAKRLAKWVQDPANQSVKELPQPQRSLLIKVNRLFYGALGTLLFIFMIMKPV